MKKTFRIALGSTVLAGGLAFAASAPANAQVRIRGSFPVPHGRISISVGDPGFPIGSYVPYGYDVYEDPDYGYGFYSDDAWIPCEQYGERWIVVERPTYYGYRDYGYARPYGYDRYGYSRHYRRDDGYRRYRRHDRRWRDDRWSRDRRYRDWDRRWRH